MDLDDFRTVLESSGVDVWTFIDTAITVASLDSQNELKQRRDGIVEKLYAASLGTNCRNCDVAERSNGYGVRNPIEEQRGKGSGEVKREPTPPTPASVERNDDDDDVDPFGSLFDDDEQKRVLEIKAQLEDPDQSEDSLVELLQSLADMEITFQTLKEIDIGRQVSRFKKHSSNDVRRLVQHLVRKWKAIVDEWVNVNQTRETVAASLFGADRNSNQQKTTQNGYHKVSDSAYSPNPHTGSSGSERNHSENEAKVNRAVMHRETPPLKQNRPASAPTTSQNRQREPQKDNTLDVDRLASARKRLQDSYKEAENAKKKRNIQVMDIHEIPKPKGKNTFFPKNKAGGSQARHW